MLQLRDFKAWAIPEHDIIRMVAATENKNSMVPLSRAEIHEMMGEFDLV
jgi:hypothetical protein